MNSREQSKHDYLYLLLLYDYSENFWLKCMWYQMIPQADLNDYQLLHVSRIGQRCVLANYFNTYNFVLHNQNLRNCHSIW